MRRAAPGGEGPPATPEEFFGDHLGSLLVYRVVLAALDPGGPVEVRVSRSQVAFRVRRGFAFLWLPGRWLRNPTSEVVLSIALDRRIDSPRFKEVAHPAPEVWIHHLEVGSPTEIDDEVVAWLGEARERAR